MNWIQPLNLGPEACHFSYRLETRDEPWSILHAHQGIELLYVHEGEGTATVDRNVFPLLSGTLLCLQPYQLHKVEVAPKEGASYIRSNITFEPRVVEPYLAPFPRLQSFLRKLWRGNLIRQTFQCPDSGYEHILANYRKAQLDRGGALDGEGMGLFLVSLLSHLQLHVVREEERGGLSSDKSQHHVERIFDWIEEHYREPFKLQSLAVALHLSPYHVSHLFHKYSGSTLSDYITGRRIREACTLLANSEMAVAEIAKEAGSYSASHFCQLFKRQKGVTPQAYRSALRKLYNDGREE